MVKFSIEEKRKNKQYVKRFFAWALGNKKKELENFLLQLENDIRNIEITKDEFKYEKLVKVTQLFFPAI